MDQVCQKLGPRNLPNALPDFYYISLSSSIVRLGFQCCPPARGLAARTAGPVELIFGHKMHLRCRSGIGHIKNPYFKIQTHCWEIVIFAKNKQKSRFLQKMAKRGQFELIFWTQNVFKVSLRYRPCKKSKFQNLDPLLGNSDFCQKSGNPDFQKKGPKGGHFYQIPPEQKVWNSGTQWIRYAKNQAPDISQTTCWAFFVFPNPPL